MPRHIHPDDDRVYACPNCDGAGEVYHRTHESKTFDHPYRCHKCDNEFDDPVERDAKANTVETPDSSEAVYGDDGLPHNLDPAAKELIRASRGS